MSNFHPREVVSRDSEAHLQMVENFNNITQRVGG